MQKRFLWNRSRGRFVRLWAFLAVGLLIAGCATDMTQERERSAALRNIGQAYLMQRDFTAALAKLLEAEAVYADDPILQNYLGLAYRAKARFAEAADHFSQAMALDPDYAPARNNLGETYLAMARWDDAIAVFEPLSEALLYATPHFVDLNLGWAYFNRNDISAALRHYQKAADYYRQGTPKDVNYLKAQRGVARCLAAQGRLEAARQIISDTIALAPDFAPLFLDLGRIEFERRDFLASAEAYRKVIALAPDSMEAREAQIALQQMP
jgi:tetratricopeptide (TPR) repeat protein